LSSAFTTFVLGYHGCDASVARDVFAGRRSLAASENDYDWLGHGVYFWEHSPDRAFEFARDVLSKPHNLRQRIKAPAVVGAVIDLGTCLNLLDSSYIALVRKSHENLRTFARRSGEPIPENTGGPDRLMRRLDCAVIELLHLTRAEEHEPPFDTVRAAFIEGKRLYKNAGFHAKNHIQLCVRNVACIKGYFRPLGESGKPIRFK
jgi:hypothetical protein